MAPMPGGASLALVDDAESICRLSFKAGIPIVVDGQHPDDVDPKDQMIRVEAISKQDLTKRGFSLQRVSFYSREMALAQPEARELKRVADGKPKAGYVLQGAFLARVSKIHGIVSNGGAQVFTVYESPTAQNPAHAEIRIDPGAKGSDFLKWRLELRRALGKLQPVTALPSHSEGILRRCSRLWRVLKAVVRNCLS